MAQNNKKTLVDYEALNKGKKFCNEDVIREVAEEFNVHESIVRGIANVQSEHTLRVMKSGTMKSIIYVYLGKFKVNARRVQKMMANQMKI